MLRAGSAGLDRKAPWFQIKEDPATAATSVYVILRVVDNLKTILAPILPHTPVLRHRTQKLHEYLGYEGQLFGTQQVVEYQEETRAHEALTYDHSGAVGTHSLRSLRRCTGQAVHAWAKSELPPGQALRQPAPLFKKLDESVIEEEYTRLKGKQTSFSAWKILNSESRGTCSGSLLSITAQGRFDSLYPATDSLDSQSDVEYNVYQNQYLDEEKYNEDYPDDD